MKSEHVFGIMVAILVLGLIILLSGYQLSSNEERKIDKTFGNYYCKKSDLNDKTVSETNQNPNYITISDPALLQTICNVIPFRDSVVAEYAWFQNEADKQRLLFRIFGMIIIIASISIPLLAQTNLQRKDLVVSMVSASIAICTSFSAFFGWGENWAQYRFTEYEYKTEIRNWDLSAAIIINSESEKPDEKIEALQRLTRNLLIRAERINLNANKNFFESKKDPLENKS